MVGLLVGMSVAVAGLGWVGYRANVRIAEWGRNMDACDDIFRTVSELTDGATIPAVEFVSVAPPRRERARAISMGVVGHV